MQYRRLGGSGLVVSNQCLGTMTFGVETAEKDAHAIIDRYLEAGGNFIDTADVYADGASEEIIGRWMADTGRRGDVILATKGRFPMSDNPNHQGLSRAWLHRAVDDSLRRLQTDHIDVYQIHCWDPMVPVDETVGAITELSRMGKIRAFGVSNLTGWQLQRYATACRTSEAPLVSSLQPQYNLLERGIEWELVPLCQLEDIGMLPWSPLGGGWLTGKYTREEGPTEDTRLGDDPNRGVEAWDQRNTERTWAIVDAVRRVADDRGVTSAQVALSWVTDRPAVASTILGVRTMEQLEDNLGAADLVLADEERTELDDVSAPLGPDYPYGLLERMTAGRRR